MKIAAFSTGCEQLTRRNVVAPNTGNGWTYFPATDYGGIAEYNPDIIWLGGVFAGDYGGWVQYKAMWGSCKRIVLHWVGSDTMICKNFWDAGQRTMFKEFHSDRFLHIPSSQGLKDELKEWFGIESTEPLDIPAEKVFEEMPKPEQYTVGFYLPPDRADFYNYQVMEELTQKFPDREYRVVFYHWLPLFHDLKLAGPWSKRFALSRTEYEQVIADCSAIVRIPKHDAVSISAGEFMMAGRPFLSNHSIPKWPARIKELTPECINDAILTSMRAPLVPKKIQALYRDSYDPNKYHDRVMARVQKQWPELMVSIPEEIREPELAHV